jgi:SNF2 family DNA or RNA helicase
VDSAGRPVDGARPLILAIKENELSIEWAPACAPRLPLAAAPAPLQGGLRLKPHQEQALAQLRALWVRGERGALLCDDMGLGKTLQGACFAAWVCDQIEAGGAPLRGPGRLPLLLVAPPSLLRTWFEEIEARLDPAQLCRIVWAGDSPPRSRCGRELVRLDSLRRDKERAPGSTVVLQHAQLDLEAWDRLAPHALFIGYDTLRSLQHAIAALDVGIAVADEVQAVKDPGSLRAHALRAMRYDFALGVTGTPIENAWVDLWAICDFALPGWLGTRDQFVRDFSPRGEVREVGARLQARLSGHLIRRTRAATLGDTLPSCTVVADRRPMPAAQALAYRAELALAGRAEGSAVLRLLQGLARTSLHPRPRATLASAAEARSWMQDSARTAAALDALDRWAAEGEPALIFVRSLAVQETLSRALCLIYDLPPVPVLNGALSFPARQETVRRMREGVGFRLLLVSPDVGGAGWNLQFAARSVLLERPFNPAVEAQMVARTWRLGQSRPVEVLAPVATLPGLTTFDEVLDGLLEEKRLLADSVLAPCHVDEQELSARFGAVLG